MSGVARAEAYDRHTGRYGAELSAAFVRFAGIEPGMRVLDVACGPGALTRRLTQIVGGDRMLAVDPSKAYADACRQRVPGAAVRVGSAEALPFDDAVRRSEDVRACRLRRRPRPRARPPR